jgi:hypothetical protein
MNSLSLRFVGNIMMLFGISMFSRYYNLPFTGENFFLGFIGAILFLYGLDFRLMSFKKEHNND